MRDKITRFLNITTGLGCLPFILLLAAACSRKQYPATTGEVIVYPTPPDTARIQYLTSFSNSAQVEGPRSRFTTFVVGEKKPRPIIKPYGVAMRDSLIYLCDLDLRGLEILDLKNKTFTYFTPRGLGQLKLPINCFVDSLGYLFVADATRRQVVVFDPLRQYAGALGLRENFKPTDVFVAHGKIWVANVTGGTVEVFSRDSTFAHLYSLFTDKKQPGRLYQPTNLFVTADRLYVSDFGEFNVKVYDLDGNWQRTIGSYGRQIGQFTRPKGVAVDRDDNLYVVDAAFENVQIFNRKGQLLMFFGGSYQGPGGMWLPAKVAVSYGGLEYFRTYVAPQYELQYLILVTNNYGPDKLNIYGYITHKPPAARSP